MRVVIADDEPLSRALLRALLAEIPDVEIVAEAGDGAEIVARVREHRPELVFLDIDMPHRNGIYAALDLAEDPVEIIFVTAHEEHAVDAFEIGAIDYVLKPVRRPRLAKAMERARTRYLARQEPDAAAQAPAPVEEPGDAFWVPMRHGTARVAIPDILRIEAAGDHVYLHTAERAYLYRITMADLESRLAGSGLIRVHRSAFIRPERVIATNRRGKVLTLAFADGSEVAVGPNYRGAVIDRLGAAG
jgi:DNA-binding LytR/AlgR family response regulator